jgi:hypothetical protein
MARAIEWETTVDTSTFSGIQIQPRVVSALTWNALARWFRSNLVSFPRLIHDEKTGVVVLGFHLHYQDKVAFAECESFRVRAAFRAMRRGERGQLDVRFVSNARVLAEARLILCPVAIEDPVSLGARPAALNERLLGRLEADEIDSASPMRVVPDRLATVETVGRLLAERKTPFIIHRHLTEVAEQWSWTEVPALVEGARENLALENRGPDRAALRGCLRMPLSRFDVEFGRPFFSFERGEIVTRAYALGNDLGMVHRLTSNNGESLHATVVEVFSA